MVKIRPRFGRFWALNFHIYHIYWLMGDIQPGQWYPKCVLNENLSIYPSFDHGFIVIEWQWGGSTVQNKALSRSILSIFSAHLIHLLASGRKQAPFRFSKMCFKWKFVHLSFIWLWYYAGAMIMKRPHGPKQGLDSVDFEHISPPPILTTSSCSQSNFTPVYVF